MREKDVYLSQCWPLFTKAMLPWKRTEEANDPSADPTAYVQSMILPMETTRCGGGGAEAHDDSWRQCCPLEAAR